MTTIRTKKLMRIPAGLLMIATASFGIAQENVKDYPILAGGLQNPRLTWVDRNGQVISSAGRNLAYRTLAPDGAQVVVRTGPKTGSSDIRLVDSNRGSSTPVTVDAMQPVWAPNGSAIAFLSQRGGAWGIYLKSSNGKGSEELAISLDGPAALYQWSPDGQFLLYSTVDAQTKSDVWVLPLLGERKPISVARTPFNEDAARFSPDGRWITYRSDESGTPQIYLQPFDLSAGTGNSATASKLQISYEGRVGSARWTPDGKEILYVGGDGAVMAVEFTSGSAYQMASRFLFRLPQSYSQTPGVIGELMDISVDGQQFMFAVPLESTWR